MKQKIKTLISKIFVIAMLASNLIFINGCGPKESQGATVGGVAGALIGAAASEGDPGATALGGLAGAAFGAALGRESDRKDQEHEHNKELRRLEAEKRRLQHQITKWCESCGREYNDANAQTCTACGGKLIREKFCSRCKSTFSPESGYRYCPYCSIKTRLKSR